MYTKDSLITKINTDLPDNTTKEIDPDELREVLIYMLDRLYNLSEIPVDVEGYTATNLEAALTEILSFTGMTAAQIRDALESLALGSRLSASKVDFAATTVEDGINTALQNILAHVNAASGAHAGSAISVSVGGMQATEVESALAELLQAISGVSLTAEEIAALLNTIITVADMVSSNRVSYNQDETTKTVQTKILEMDLAVAGTQSQITKKRILYSSAINNVMTVTGVTTDVIQMCINRVPYQGIESADFSGGAGAFDFIYQFSSGNVQIMLNPDMPVANFEPGMIIDLLF